MIGYLIVGIVQKVFSNVLVREKILFVFVLIHIYARVGGGVDISCSLGGWHCVIKLHIKMDVIRKLRQMFVLFLGDNSESKELSGFLEGVFLLCFPFFIICDWYCRNYILSVLVWLRKWNYEFSCENLHHLGHFWKKNVWEKLVLDIHMLVLFQSRFENVLTHFRILQFFHMGLGMNVFYQGLIVQVV